MSMTPQTIVKLTSAVATSIDGILAYGDRIADVPGVLPAVAHAWPLILLGIVALDRGLHAFLGEPVPSQIDTSKLPTIHVPTFTSEMSTQPVPVMVNGQLRTMNLTARIVPDPPQTGLPDPQAFRAPVSQPIQKTP